MKNKIYAVVVMLICVVFTFASVYAEDTMFSVGAYEKTYKASEQKEIKLPFFNICTAKTIYDKPITHSGISIVDSTVEVLDEMDDVQVIFSTDMVTIKGEVENVVVYANNIVVEGKITGTSILVAPTVKFTETAQISTDVILVANDFETKGIVKGSILGSISEKAIIAGKVESDLRLVVHDIDLKDSDIKGEVYLKTNALEQSITEKYPSAIVKPIIEEEQEKDNSEKIVNSVTKGIVTVAIYALVAFLITKKDNNIATQFANKFKQNSAYGIIAGTLGLMSTIIVPLILLFIALMGLGVVAWPLLIAYLAVILLSISMSSFVVGITIYESIKCKVEKYKLLAIIGIFTLIYAMLNIPVISGYAIIAVNLISLAIILTYITKKNKVEEKVEVKTEE